MLKRCHYLPIMMDLFFLTPSQGFSSENDKGIFRMKCLEWQQEHMEASICHCRNQVQEYAFNNFLVLQMFDDTVSQWQSYYIQSQGNFDLPTLLKALSFAAFKHHGQTRDNALATPYIIHPIGVARLLWEEGNIRNESILISALLHDTLEDTETTGEEIEILFGSKVRDTVEELTDDPSLSTQENKQRQVDHAPYLSLDAQLVKLADRLYNVRDLRISPPNWEEAKIRMYLNWGQKLLDALRGINEGLEQALQKEIFIQMNVQTIVS